MLFHKCVVGLISKICGRGRVLRTLHTWSMLRNGWGKVFKAHTCGKSPKAEKTTASKMEEQIVQKPGFYINENRRSEFRVFESISDWMKSLRSFTIQSYPNFCPMGVAMILPQMNASYLPKTPKNMTCFCNPPCIERLLPLRQAFPPSEMFMIC